MANSTQCTRRDEPFIPEIPSEDWDLNILLDEIANEITENELKRIKSYLIGGTGKRTLEEIKDAYDLFTHLRQTRRLTRDNTIVLQAMLFHLKRRDLQKKVIVYAKSLGNVLHFYPATEEPENGYRHVKVHVSGAETFDRQKLETLRERMARLLAIPASFVLVNGIEHGNSVLVTFSIPTGYEDVLYIIEKDDASILLAAGVDFIIIGKKTIDLQNLDNPNLNNCAINTTVETNTLSNRVKQLESDIDEKLARLIKTEREKRWYKSQLAKLQVTVSSNDYIARMIQLMWMYNMYVRAFKPFERLSTKAARAYFQTMFKEAQRLNYSQDILRALIEANGMVIKARINEDFFCKLMMKDAQIYEMASRIEFLRYEKDKLAFYLNIGEKSPILTEKEEFFLRTVANPFLQQVLPISTITTTQFNLSRPELEAIFSELSKELSKEDRSKLLPDLCDNDRKLVKKTPNALLKILHANEIEKSKGQTSLCPWIENLFKTLNRVDLIQKFHQLVQTTMLQTANPSDQKQDKDIHQKSASTPKSHGLKKSPSSKQRRRRCTVPGSIAEKGQTDSEQSSSGIGEMENENGNSLSEFQILNGKMQKIESALESLVSMNRQHDFPFSTFRKGADNTLSSISSFIPKHPTT